MEPANENLQLSLNACSTLCPLAAHPNLARCSASVRCLTPSLTGRWLQDPPLTVKCSGETARRTSREFPSSIQQEVHTGHERVALCSHALGILGCRASCT